LGSGAGVVSASDWADSVGCSEGARGVSRRRRCSGVMPSGRCRRCSEPGASLLENSAPLASSFDITSLARCHLPERPARFPVIMWANRVVSRSRFSRLSHPRALGVTWVFRQPNRIRLVR